jgi:protein ImuB
MCSLMVVCVLIPRFALLGALGDRRALLGEPVALAPESGGEQRVGDVSSPAEAFGVVPGMGVGEALTRCPALVLLPPDPEGVRGLWAKLLDRLEGIGASVESDAPGIAYFAAAGLRGIHGGRLEDVLAAARRALRRPPSPPVAGARIGAGPSRFTAYVAATRARPGRRGPARARLGATAVERRSEVVVRAGAAAGFLAPLPVALLRSRRELEDLPDLLERLGVRTLGDLAGLSVGAVVERFGHPGLLALDLAAGRDTPLDPRRPPEPVFERLALPEAAGGRQLERALELLVARVLARRERRGRSLRSVWVTARFVEGGTWRARTTLRAASADPERIRLALAPRLAELPAPAESIGLEVEAFGPPAHEQGRLSRDPREVRRARLGEAVRHARAAGGDGAALRAMEVDPDSRIPERRSVLAPYPVEEERP